MTQEAMSYVPSWSVVADSFMGEALISLSLWAVFLGLAGMLTAIVVMVVLAKKKLLQREHWLWNVLAKLSYLAIFAGAISAGVATGATYGAQRQIHDTLESDVQPWIESRMPAFRQYLSKTIGVYLPGKLVTVRELIEPFVKDMYYVPKSGDTWEQTKAQVINEMILVYAAEVLTEQVQKVVSRQLASLGVAVDDALSANGGGARGYLASDLGKVFAQGASNVDLTRLDATIPQVVVSAIYKQVTTYFKTLYLSIGLSVLLLALVIWGEIFVYSRVRGARTPAAV